jgi:hypothetical protein
VGSNTVPSAQIMTMPVTFSGSALSCLCCILVSHLPITCSVPWVDGGNPLSSIPYMYIPRPYLWVHNVLSDEVKPQPHIHRIQSLPLLGVQGFAPICLSLVSMPQQESINPSLANWFMVRPQMRCEDILSRIKEVFMC